MEDSDNQRRRQQDFILGPLIFFSVLLILDASSSSAPLRNLFLGHEEKTFQQFSVPIRDLPPEVTATLTQIEQVINLRIGASEIGGTEKASYEQEETKIPIFKEAPLASIARLLRGFEKINGGEEELGVVAERGRRNDLARES